MRRKAKGCFRVTHRADCLSGRGVLKSVMDPLLGGKSPDACQRVAARDRSSLGDVWRFAHDEVQFL